MKPIAFTLACRYCLKSLGRARVKDGLTYCKKCVTANPKKAWEGHDAPHAGRPR